MAGIDWTRVEWSSRSVNGEIDVLKSFVLTRPADVLRDAFGAVVDEVAKGVGETPIVYGRPA